MAAIAFTKGTVDSYNIEIKKLIEHLIEIKKIDSSILQTFDMDYNTFAQILSAIETLQNNHDGRFISEIRDKSCKIVGDKYERYMKNKEYGKVYITIRVSSRSKLEAMWLTIYDFACYYNEKIKKLENVSKS